MFSFIFLVISVMPIFTCVPVTIREKELDTVILASESALQSVLRLDHHKCFLKFVCDVGANYSASGSFAYKVTSSQGLSMEPFDFSVVDQPVFLQLLNSKNPEIVDVVSLKKLDEVSTTELLSGNSPDEGLSGRHCPKFDKSLIYVKNQNGYFKSVSWKRVQSTTTPRPPIFKFVRQHQKHQKNPVTTVRPKQENHTRPAPTSTEKPTVPVPGLDFNQILRLIKELSDRLTNSGPKDLDDKATSASNSPIVLSTLDQQHANMTRLANGTGGSTTHSTAVLPAENIRKNLTGLTNETAKSPASSTIDLPVENQHANLTDPVNATTNDAFNPVAILLDLSNFSENEGVIPSLEKTTNSTELDANVDDFDNTTKDAAEVTDFSDLSNSTGETVPENPQELFVEESKNNSDGQETVDFEDSFSANVSSDDTSNNNSNVLAEVKDAAADQDDLEGRNDIYPGAFVFNRAFDLGLVSGHASCERIFRDCFTNSGEVIEFGTGMVTRLQTNYLGALIE